MKDQVNKFKEEPRLVERWCSPKSNSADKSVDDYYNWNAAVFKANGYELPSKVLLPKKYVETPKYDEATDAEVLAVFDKDKHAFKKGTLNFWNWPLFLQDLEAYCGRPLSKSSADRFRLKDLINGQIRVRDLKVSELLDTTVDHPLILELKKTLENNLPLFEQYKKDIV